MENRTEREQQLWTILNHYTELRAQYPELSDTRLLNRLHNLGIACTPADLIEALSLVTVPVPEPELAAPIEERIIELGDATYYDIHQASRILNIDENRFKSWWLPSYAKIARTKKGYVPLPEGCPEPLRLNPHAIGRPALFSAQSIYAIKRFFQENPI